MKSERRRCKHCHCYFEVCPKVKKHEYCRKPECQKARKRAWQKRKMAEDETYRRDQKEAQEIAFAIRYVLTGEVPYLAEALGWPAQDECGDPV